MTCVENRNMNYESLIDNTVQTNRSKKLALNINKFGTVRDINDKEHVDFLYLGHRVRESSGLPSNKDNAKIVREQLDRIGLAIKDGTFEFRKVFPKSKKVDFFSELERSLLGRTRQPSDVLFKDFAWEWYATLKATGGKRERTLLGYKSLLRLYLVPFFGEMPFGKINAVALDRFTAWARSQEYRNKPISNTSINKCLIPLQMICKRAAITYEWGASYNPFLVTVISRTRTRKIKLIRFLSRSRRALFPICLNTGNPISVLPFVLGSDAENKCLFELVT